ncbi:helix-turn-helix transcriptional regulator [Sphingomonas sp. GB1N7]|uniref:helix-turn-helix transcriptional regulator n=1 Tax=Parasphingomonas caseinilytica TaxID=3096158 RepID=UPI002FC92ADE
MTGYLTIVQVVERLPVSRSTFFLTVRRDPAFPKPRFVGKKPYWREEDIKDWLA